MADVQRQNGLFQKIHILGASGTGTTTLAKALCAQLSYVHFDSDDFFWENKFSIIRPPAQRLERLGRALENEPSWILSGAVIDWGNPLIPLFDGVIFLSVPHSVRMKRLELREKELYGDDILPGGTKYKGYLKFMEWAACYETGGDEVRSRYQQEKWLAQLDCQVLRIQGDSSVEENLVLALDFLQSQ